MRQERVKLRFGPYKTPRFKYGDVVFCERFGEVRITGLSGGRIPWPTCRQGKRNVIILFKSLVNAVRRESSAAVQYWWGVGHGTLTAWRKVLEVPIANAGTSAQMSDAKIRSGTRPPHGRAWTASEDALLAEHSPPEVATRTGRSLDSVWCRRQELGLPDGRATNGRVPKGGTWKAEEDSLFAILTTKEIAARTGRPLKGVYLRRLYLRRRGVALKDGRESNGQRQTLSSS